MDDNDLSAAARASEPALVSDQAPAGLDPTGFDQAQRECRHLATIRSCGIKVCFDCGKPMNARALAVARMQRA